MIWSDYDLVLICAGLAREVKDEDLSENEDKKLIGYGYGAAFFTSLGGGGKDFGVAEQREAGNFIWCRLDLARWGRAYGH